MIPFPKQHSREAEEELRAGSKPLKNKTKQNKNYKKLLRNRRWLGLGWGR